jgi:hypothetical protein
MLSLLARSDSNSRKGCLGALFSIAVPEHRKIEETVLYDGKYRSLVQRQILMPDNTTVATFDVVVQKSESVLVFVWDTNTSTTTLIQEFHPGIEKLMIGTVAGMYEPHKHGSALECAQFELEEEAHLRSSRWVPLLDELSTAAPFHKYSNNRFYPFLAIDCDHVASPRPRDAEEHITVLRHVGYRQLMSLISAGRVNVLSSYAALLGINKLRQLAIPLE